MCIDFISVCAVTAITITTCVPLITIAHWQTVFDGAGTMSIARVRNTRIDNTGIGILWIGAVAICGITGITIRTGITCIARTDYGTTAVITSAMS